MVLKFAPSPLKFDRNICVIQNVIIFDTHRPRSAEGRCWWADATTLDTRTSRRPSSGRILFARTSPEEKARKNDTQPLRERGINLVYNKCCAVWVIRGCSKYILAGVLNPCRNIIYGFLIRGQNPKRIYGKKREDHAPESNINRYLDFLNGNFANIILNLEKNNVNTFLNNEQHKDHQFN
jgi:hypothetical protein